VDIYGPSLLRDGPQVKFEALRLHELLAHFQEPIIFSVGLQQVDGLLEILQLLGVELRNRLGDLRLLHVLLPLNILQLGNIG